MTPGEVDGALTVVGTLASRPGGDVLLARDRSRGGALVVVKPAAPDRAPPLLRHRNLAAVLGVGGGWLIAEYVEGVDFRSSVRSLPPAEPDRTRAAASLVLGVAEGLWALHEAGHAHGDLRPANVLVAGGVFPKLIDYSQTGPQGGTLAYLAPERIGAPSPPSAAADAYALGILLYEAVHGRHPFADVLDAPADLARRHLEHGVRPPDGARLSPAWSLIERLVDRSPAARPSDHAITSALEDLAADARVEPLWPALTPALDRIQASCLEAFASGAPAAVVWGPPGSGRTRLLHAVANRLRGRAAVVWVASAEGTEGEFLPSCPEVAPPHGVTDLRIVLADVGATAARRSRQGEAIVRAVEGGEAPEGDVIRLPPPPPDVAIDRRVAVLEPRVRELLTAAALAGGELHADEIDRLGFGEETLARAVASGLGIRRGGIAVASRSIRLCLLHDLDAASAERVAAELLPGLDPGRTTDLGRAAELAARARRPEAAALLERAALTFERLDRPGAALASLETLLEIVPDHRDAMRARVRGLRSLGSTREAVDAASRLHDAAVRTGDERLRGEALRLRAAARIGETMGPQAAREAERDVALALARIDRLEPRERGLLLMTAAGVAGAQGEMALARGRAGAALECFSSAEDLHLRLAVKHNLADYARLAGDLTEAGRLLEEVFPEFEHCGQTRYAAIACSNLAIAYVGLGRLWSARERTLAAEKRFAELGDRASELMARSNRLCAELHLGLHADDLDAIARLARGVEPDEPNQAGNAYVNLAVAWRLRGDLAAAEGLARRARSIAQEVAIRALEVEATAELAQVAAAAGSAHARLLAGTALARAPTDGAPTTVAPALLAAARAGLRPPLAMLAAARARAQVEWMPLVPLLDLERGRLLAAIDPEAQREAFRAGAHAFLQLADGAAHLRAALLARGEVRALACALLGGAVDPADLALAERLLPADGRPAWANPLLECARFRLAGRGPSSAGLREALRLGLDDAQREDVTRAVERLARMAAREAPPARRTY